MRVLEIEDRRMRMDLERRERDETGYGEEGEKKDWL